MKRHRCRSSRRSSSRFSPSFVTSDRAFRKSAPRILARAFEELRARRIEEVVIRERPLEIPQSREPAAGPSRIDKATALFIATIGDAGSSS